MGARRGWGGGARDRADALRTAVARAACDAINTRNRYNKRLYKPLLFCYYRGMPIRNPAHGTIFRKESLVTLSVPNPARPRPAWVTKFYEELNAAGGRRDLESVCQLFASMHACYRIVDGVKIPNPWQGELITSANNLIKFLRLLRDVK